MSAVHPGGRGDRASEVHGEPPLSSPRLRPAAGALSLAALTAALRRRVLDGPPLPGERWARRHRLLLPYDLPRTRRLIRHSGALGSPTVAGATVVLGACLLERRVSRRAAGGLLLSAGVAPATRALKRRWGPTPRFRAEVQRAPATPNYPSGHVAYAVSVFGYLGVLARRERQPAGCALALLVVLGVGPARALDGSHLLSDVLGGYALGAAWLLLTVAATMDGAGPRVSRGSG